MKREEMRQTEGRKVADMGGEPLVKVGHIPGLERLLPGCYRPGQIVCSRYGKWTLPRAFRGQPITAIINGILFG
jgi:hypothetical protein